MTDTATLRTIVNGKEVPLPLADFLERLAQAPFVLVDVGTGDGMYPYREAREHPDWLCIGVDPAAITSVRKPSGKIGKKPAKGGVDNLIYIASALEALPEKLRSIADLVTVNLPWGKLLRDMVKPDLDFIRNLRILAKDTATFEIMLNMQVFDDKDLCEKLGYKHLDEEIVNTVFIPEYKKVGIEIVERRLLGPGPLPKRTTWGQRLSVGSRRDTLIMKGHAI